MSVQLTAERASAVLGAILAPGTPFPWQERLLRLLISGDVPTAVDLPTGLGKTSVIAIWLLARAAGAKLPRRLVYVVDRRAVVDQATDVADRLVGLVSESRELAEALDVGDRGLAVSTLRGQHIDNRRWLDDPCATAIVVGTVDMIGSRLLFEGYGVGRKTRSLHAALLGVDSLLVLDEAHLSPSFEAMVRAIGDAKYDGARTDIVPPRVRVLPLSATQHAQTSKSSFELDNDDMKNDEVRRRLDAQKWVALHDLLSNKDDGRNPHAEKVAGIVLERIDAGAERVVVYLDSREQTQAAQEAFEKLARSKGLEIDTELLVGARRVFERNNVADWLDRHGFHGDSKEPKRGVLFATSAGEVGVDLDAEHMVCDLVAFERMVQRLGRVNRRGKHTSLIDVVPLKKADKKEKKEGDEEDGPSSKDADLAKVYELFSALPSRSGDARRNASPRALRELQKSSADAVAAASTPPPLHPPMSRPLVDAWAMTSLEEHAARPRVDPWLRGWVDVEPQTAIVWRKHLPVDVERRTLLHQRVQAYFEAAPAELVETLETETFHVVKWLKDLGKRADGADDDVVAFIVDGSGEVVREGGVAGLTRAKLFELAEARNAVRRLAGRTLFLDESLGGLERGLLNAKEGAFEVPPASKDAPGRGTRSAWPETLEEDTSKEWRRVFSAPVDVDDDGEIVRFLVIDQRIQARPDEDGLSISKEQSLTEHQSWAGDEAQRIGEALGLPADDVAMLVLAAVHHDDGKASKRWQDAFHAPAGTQPLAKVGRWIDQSVLAGYRHEAGSLLGLLGLWDVYPHAKAKAAFTSLTPGRQELAKHLVSSHHGWSRPTLPIEGCDGAPPSRLVHVQREVAERFAALQAEWGPWGLAWWEALLRAADGIASRNNELRDLPKDGDA